ncbi:MAG: glycosyl hydrolase, partial [Betaproteobacteria bacterium]
AEQNAVDNGAAGQFFRTGRQFATGGTSPVCRFYGSISPGPNSHFFTVDVNECNALKAAQVTPTPTTVQQWNFERNEYLTTPPNVAGDGTRSCPGNTTPLYRAYNNAFPLSGGKNPWDSNHRFTSVHADIDALVALGWRDEGIVFCTLQ